MTTSPAQLLKLLGSGIQPGAMQAPTAAGGSTLFADLLRRAQDGSLASATPVTIAPDAGVECSDEQLARLSLAADKLEAAGVRTALVNIDGQRLLLDVHGREIMGPALDEGGVIAGIDGVIDLGGARTGATDGTGSATTAGKLAPPSTLAAHNASLLKLLTDLQAS